MTSLPVMVCALVLAVGPETWGSVAHRLEPEQRARRRGHALARKTGRSTPPDPPGRSRGVTVTLRSPSPLVVRWYKPLLVHGATITSDGGRRDRHS